MMERYDKAGIKTDDKATCKAWNKILAAADKMRKKIEKDKESSAPGAVSEQNVPCIVASRYSNGKLVPLGASDLDGSFFFGESFACASSVAELVCAGAFGLADETVMDDVVIVSPDLLAYSESARTAFAELRDRDIDSMCYDCRIQDGMFEVDYHTTGELMDPVTLRALLFPFPSVTFKGKITGRMALACALCIYIPQLLSSVRMLADVVMDGEHLSDEDARMIFQQCEEEGLDMDEVALGAAWEAMRAIWREETLAAEEAFGMTADEIVDLVMDIARLGQDERDIIQHARHEGNQAYLILARGWVEDVGAGVARRISEIETEPGKLLDLIA